MAGLKELQAKHNIIGDVRGRGLFLGFELVKDRETKEPAAVEAARIVDTMRDKGVLLSTDGPYHNVIKIKPPMMINEEDITFTTNNLDRCLSSFTHED